MTPDFQSGSACIRNPPGQPALRFRIGTFDTFFRAMVGRISTETPTAGEPPPLAFLNLEPPENWIVGLLHAWARSGDVLTFYQERIINEGYFGTATQDLSVREMLRGIGYSPCPPLASFTDLVFLAAPGREMPEEVSLPAGARVDSLPANQRPAQTFETDDDLILRFAWNEIRLAVPKEKVFVGADGKDLKHFTGETTSLVLAGLLGALNPGAVLLLTGYIPSSGLHVRCMFLRTLTGVRGEPGPPGKARTVVEWKLPLGSGQPSIHPKAKIDELEVFVLKKRGFLFGYNAPVWDRLPVKERRRYHPILGGVLESDDHGKTWKRRNGDGEPTAVPKSDQGLLPAVPIHALLATADGDLFAAGDVGVYRAAAAGLWQPVTEGMRARRVLCMTADPDRGQIFAGTDDGLIFRSVDHGNTWEPTAGMSPVTLAGALKRLRLRRKIVTSPPRAPIRALAIVNHQLLAATDSGVFLGTEQGDVWRAVNNGFPRIQPTTQLTGLAVFALLSYRGRNPTYAGTERGVFFSNDIGTKCSWTAFNDGFPGAAHDDLPRLRVKTLLLPDPSDLLYAGTDQGLFERRITLKGSSWTQVKLPIEPQPEVLALAALGETIFVGTPKGLFRCRDGEQIKLQEPPDPVKKPSDPAKVTALAVRRLGEKETIVAATPFDGFGVHEWPGFGTENHISLDLSTLHKDVAPGSWIALFQPDTKQDVIGIYRVARTCTVRRQGFSLSAMVTRVELESDVKLKEFDRRNTAVLFASEPLALATRLRPVQAILPIDTAHLLLPAIDPPLPQQRRLLLTGRKPDGAPVTQAVTVGDYAKPNGKDKDKGKGKDKEPWTLTIEPPLAAPLEASSVLIYGNVGRATQGETVHQVLGSGDAARAGQRFVLSRPLNFLPAPWKPAGWESTLRVEVDGVPWTEVASLLDANPDDRVYTAGYDLEGRTLVSFGDGTHGARLPTGHHNVRAVYRSGVWPQSLEPWELSVPRTRPAGLRSVFNPTAVPGGIPAETLDRSRARAPRTVRTLDRVVTLDDLRDFTAAYPGIADSLVNRLVDGRLAVTVAGLEGRPVSADGELHRGLMQELKSLSVPRLVPEWLGFYQPVTFQVALCLTAEPDADAGALVRTVEETLARTFGFAAGFAAARFLETVCAYQISAAVRRIAGVAGVEMLVFQPADDGEPPPEIDGDPPLVRSITALPAVLTQIGRVLPAQLLALDRASLRLEVCKP